MDVEEGVAAVFLDAVVGDLIADVLAVGRSGVAAYAPHGPQGLGGERVGGEGDVAPMDDVVASVLRT